MFVIQIRSNLLVMNSKITPINSNLLPPVITLVSVLPFEAKEWEEFEQLCLDLAQIEFSIQDCERYGKQGESQEGIDIFARHSDGKYTVYQCKKHKTITVKKLDSIISEFKKETFFDKSKCFIICSSCELNSTNFQQRFLKHKEDLSKHNIELIKWDKLQLSRILKKHPEIVYRFFGKEWVEAFNGKEALNPLLKISDKEIIDSFKSASCELSFISNNFRNLPNSHINRKETTEILNWINKPLEEEESNICILAGNAGTGKTVILKDIFDLLNSKNIPVLGLKADKKTLDKKNRDKSILCFDEDVQLKNIFQRLLVNNETVVLLIDQIDALSQSLSTNREQINIYTSLINQLSQINGLRIIISCRIFDLHHDGELRQYANKKEIIVSLLIESEIACILKLLTGKGLDFFPKELIELLKTPLYLDLFCRIYNNNTDPKAIKTSQDLYRSLWKQKIKDVKLKSNFEPSSLEEVLFKLANTIYERQDNLSAPSQLFDSSIKEIEYLVSENLITDNQYSIQFFHQSFYDYTFARNFVENKGSDIYDFLINQHQGLFIRAITKQVLAYLRIYNPKTYIQQLNNLLFSSEIRYHIKLLILEQLSFEDNPTPSEFKVILSLIDYSKSLSSSFFNSIPNPKWYEYFKRKKELLINLLNSDDAIIVESLSRFVVFSANSDLNSTFQILLKILDIEKRNSLIDWTLIRTNDFTPSIVKEMYYLIDKEYIKSNRQRFHILDNALKTEIDFAIAEAKKVFNSSLEEWKKKRRSELSTESEEREIFDFCEKLNKENSLKSYFFLKEIIHALIDSTVFEPYHKYNLIKTDEAFNDYDSFTYPYHKYVDWVVETLTKESLTNLSFVKAELESYISSNSATQIYIALQVYSNNPTLFIEEIHQKLINKDLVEDFVNHEDLKYQYRVLLEKSYILYTGIKQAKIINFILTFITKDEYYAWSKENREKYKRPLYANLERNKWLLLNSIPISEVNQDKKLRIKLSELNRRFHQLNGENKKTNHRATISKGVGNLLSKKQFQKLSIKHWYNSFVKYVDEMDCLIYKNFSVDEYAKSFREIVKENPIGYYQFIIRIANDNLIHPRYKIAGLEGLIEAEYDIVQIRSLFETLINTELSKPHLYTAIRISKAFIIKSHIDEDLILFWKQHALAPFEKREFNVLINNEDERNDELFSEGWCTTNAEALILLVNLSFIEKYQTPIYLYLLEICSGLPIQLRLVVLHEISFESRFTDEQELTLFLNYIQEISSEIYYAAPDLINRLFSKSFVDLIPFIKQTINMPKVAKSLGIYLLYGWFYGFDESKELLLELHTKQPSSIKETIIEACKYFSDLNFKDKCLFILQLYIKDKRKEIREAFAYGFSEFKADDFNTIKVLIIEYIKYLDDDRLHSLYQYLILCAKDYSLECIEILDSIGNKKAVKSYYDLKDPIELITLCYNAIKEYTTSDENIEHIMDVFDNILTNQSSSIEVDRILKDVDCV